MSTAAAQTGLYTNYKIKDQLVLGPEECHWPKVASSGDLMEPAQPVSRCAKKKCNRQQTKSIHRGEKPYICEECSSTFISKSRLRKHLQLTHLSPRVVIIPMREYVYSDLRRSKFTTKTLLLDHKKRDRGVTSFKCSECKYMTVCKKSLQAHIKSHNGKKFFHCKYCSFSSKYKHSILNHQKLHTGERHFQCAYCDYTFCAKSALQAHLRTHTVDKKYQCSHCNVMFHRKFDLKRHLNIHTSEKPFHCAHCDYKFRRRDKLLIHEKVHTGEKPFKCSHCDYASLRKDGLQRHLKLKHFSYVSAHCL